MPLDQYLEKRSFTKTPEPTGGKSDADKLIFVVQKHAASHLHYDFRLEVKGVLKSWAVQKGPSMNPAEHRLAMEVEDHPFDYKNFEGIIPKGQYGGGTVIIWDQGTYEPAEKLKTKKEQEHWMTSHYYKKSIRIKMKGQKLKGEFLLERIRERGDNSWLLSKVDDKYATATDISKKDKSVVSGLTIEGMTENAGAAVWQSNRVEKPQIKPKHAADEVSRHAGKKKAFPDKLEPMLSTLVREPFTDDDWLYEVKFDGFRIVAYHNEGKITLRSRKLNQTKKFPLLVEELSKIDHEFIIDGEVVALNEDGLPDFDALQRNATEELHLKYYVFDMLYLDGYDLTGLPLTERRELLQEILPDSEIIAYSQDFDDGTALFEAIKAKGLEGIMAKRRDSTYSAGKRSNSWLKIPTKKVQEFVIGAWTESESGHAFRSMIFGNYVNGKLQYVGHVGHGFKEEERRQILAKLEPLEIKKNPFSGKVDTQTKVRWVKPELVASIEFSTWTTAGNIRKPAVFKGWREDKDPKEVVPEEPLTTREKQQVIASGESTASAFEERPLVTLSGVEGRPPVPEKTEKASYANTDSNWKDLDTLPVEDPRDLPVGDHIVKVHNLDKVLWEDEQVTKAALMAYYGSMADYILPYIKNRPLSLYIKHLSPTAPGLYIKDMEGRQPEFAEVFATERKHKKKGKRGLIEYLVCNNAATLMYIINLGAIDLNPWSSRITSPDTPDYITIDLDPSDGDFRKAVETARAAKEFFDEHKLKTFIKTSGKTGLHILIPCSGFTFPEARSIGSAICDEIQKRVPAIATRERSISKRGDLLYVDDSQNDYADTIASAYSVRPFHIPTVSTPLEWKEVNDKLDPSAFTIHTIPKRLAKKGDLLKDLIKARTAANNNDRLHKI